jgi:hypothetical protein
MTCRRIVLLLTELKDADIGLPEWESEGCLFLREGGKKMAIVHRPGSLIRQRKSRQEERAIKDLKG